MKPDSNYHLAFNLGYPNAFDKAQGRTGQFLMIHGKCKSVGCYAMTDALIEEIYALARESFLGANDSFQVHAFPFHMTPENMARHANHEAYPFWKTLKEGYDYFEYSRQIPTVAVCNRRYVVNVAWPGGESEPAQPRRRLPGLLPAEARPLPAAARRGDGGVPARHHAGAEDARRGQHREQPALGPDRPNRRHVDLGDRVLA